MRGTAARALAQIRAGRKPYLWHEAFAIVAGASARDGAVRVLDFGGGVATGFVQLLASLPESITIDYVVVDNAEMCRTGRELFDADSRIRFETSLEAVTGQIDVLYVNGVLPYIDDYATMIARLTAVGARRIFLARLAAGPIPTFASQQVNVPGRVFPYWFLNIDEVVDRVTRGGYLLSCDSYVDKQYDMTNLPEAHRVDRFRNLLFTRNDL